ncbi:3-oxoacyl-ACP reductase FabG [Candidatus Binatia bacterium]|nr:3-oxoacyl-ACP reductase FabG [Candidatus Binatia bacterium]
MQGLDGKIAFVTGAARGIGRAIANRLAAEGATVVAADIDASGAQKTAAEIGGAALGLTLDVTDSGSIRSAVANAEQRLQRIDVLVNNAGWDKVEPFVQSTEDTWDRVLAINLRGPIACTRAVLDGMIARRAGRIVSISSDAARVGSTGEAVYAAAKAGIIGFSKTLARELARYGINVNVVCPGPTDTPLLQGISAENPKIAEALKRAIPFGRLADPAEIAAAVAFFASDDAAFVTGQTLSVSGGLTMV